MISNIREGKIRRSFKSISCLQMKEESQIFLQMFPSFFRFIYQLNIERGKKTFRIEENALYEHSFTPMLRLKREEYLISSRWVQGHMSISISGSKESCDRSLQSSLFPVSIMHQGCRQEVRECCHERRKDEACSNKVMHWNKLHRLLSEAVHWAVFATWFIGLK